MHQREIRRFMDAGKAIVKNERKDDLGFFEELDLMDFKDDLEYK